MSAQSSPIGYSLFDLLTRVVPGFTAILPLAIGYTIVDFQVELPVQITVLSLGVFALIVGEFVDLIRSARFRVPSPFKEVVYHQTGDERILSKSDKLSLRLERLFRDKLGRPFTFEDIGRTTVFHEAEADLQTEYEQHLGLSWETSSTFAIYSALLSYMDSRMSSQTRRYYILRIFAQNLIIASVITMILFLIVAVQNLDDPTTIVITVFSIFVLFLVVEVAFIFLSASYPYVDSLLIDYYVERVSAE